MRLAYGGGQPQTSGGTSNPQAYDLFLRGLESELRNTPEDIVKAIALYEQALTLDPNFGIVHGELAWVYWNVDEQRRRALGITWDEVEAKLNEYLDALLKTLLRTTTRYMLLY